MAQQLVSKKESLKTRLGSDLKYPINGKFEPIEGLDLLLQDLQILLLTVPGERVNRPNFGCNLKNQLWENIDSAAIKGASSIRTAIEKFEPRITLLNIKTDVNRNTGLIVYQINFIIKSTDVQANLIFPFRAGTTLSFA